MKKKLLSMLMVMAMVLTLVPMTAMAYGSTSVGSSNAGGSRSATIHFYVQEGSLYQSSMASISQATHVTDVNVTAYYSNYSVSASEFMKCLPSAYADYDNDTYAYVSSSEYGFGSNASIYSSSDEFYVIFSGSVPSTGGGGSTGGDTELDEDEVEFTFYNLYWQADGSYKIGESITSIETNKNTTTKYEDMYYVYTGIVKEAADELGSELADGYEYTGSFSYTPTGSQYDVPDSAYSTSQSIYYNGSSSTDYTKVYIHATAEAVAEPEPTYYTVDFDSTTITNGGEMVAVADEIVEDGKSLVLPTASRDGTGSWDYQFTGWSDGDTIYQAGEDYPVTGDATLTATWSLYSIDGNMIWNVFDAMEIMGQYDGTVFLTDEQLAVGDYDKDGTTSTVFDAMEIMEMYKNETTV